MLFLGLPSHLPDNFIHHGLGYLALIFSNPHSWDEYFIEPLSMTEQC